MVHGSAHTGKTYEETPDGRMGWAEYLEAVFSRVPFVTMFGDFQGGNPVWQGRMVECVNTVDRIKAVRGTAENIYLPDRGIRGNSHMLIMDLNNRQLADIILAWLVRYARSQ